MNKVFLHMLNRFHISRYALFFTSQITWYNDENVFHVDLVIFDIVIIFILIMNTLSLLLLRENLENQGKFLRI